jgi:peptidoglycan DL-endopeptidase CwlO
VSIESISPVIGRIQSIESRFSVPAGARVSRNAGAGTPDAFAAALSAAFSDSSATLLSGAPAAAGSGSTSLTSGITTHPTATLPLAPSAANGTYGTPLTATSAVSSTATTAADGATAYTPLFQAAGARHGVPAELLSAVGYIESRYRPEAVSSAGAIGLMQIMPFVADELGVDPTDPAQAIDGAARLLRAHYERFGSWDLALAAYNAGAGAVKNAGNSIPSPGVAEYVRRVNERMATT